MNESIFFKISQPEEASGNGLQRPEEKPDATAHAETVQITV